MNVWYGYSTDAKGTQWRIGNNNQPVLQGDVNPGYDYPSIGVDASGRVIIGAPKYVLCPPPNNTSNCIIGYYTAVSTDGQSFTGPYTVITGTGDQSRVVATNNVFEAFVPTLDSVHHTPTYIARYESTDGRTWPLNDLTIGMGSFALPLNNSPQIPPTQGSIFYAPLLAAQGYTNGLWTVSFQANVGGYNNAFICTSDRGCGYILQKDDEFLVGTSVSAEGGYWLTYYTYSGPQAPRTLPLRTQAWYFPPGLDGLSNTVNSSISPTSWLNVNTIPGFVRCDPGATICFAAGDFNTVASNPFAAATLPFILTGQGNFFQDFLQDPPGDPAALSSQPGFVPIPRGADVRNLGLPLPPLTSAPPPGSRIGLGPSRP